MGEWLLEYEDMPDISFDFLHFGLPLLNAEDLTLFLTVHAHLLMRFQKRWEPDDIPRVFG